MEGGSGSTGRSPTTSPVGLVGSLLGRGERNDGGGVMGSGRSEVRWLMQWLNERRSYTSTYENRNLMMTKKGE